MPTNVKVYMPVMPVIIPQPSCGFYTRVLIISNTHTEVPEVAPVQSEKWDKDEAKNPPIMILRSMLRLILLKKVFKTLRIFTLLTGGFFTVFPWGASSRQIHFSLIWLLFFQWRFVWFFTFFNFVTGVSRLFIRRADFAFICFFLILEKIHFSLAKNSFQVLRKITLFSSRSSASSVSPSYYF